MSWLGAAVDWQSRAVVMRHLRVYLRNWHTAFLPPALEPVTMLVAFGLGLGGYVATLRWQGHPIEYMTYVAPGLLAYATFMTAIFQSLFGAFIRMRYQRTWEGQLTTHYMDEAERLSDALTVLARGRVVAHGTAKTVLGDLVGEHVIVLDAAAATGVAVWLRQRGRGEPAGVLGAWHVPVSSEELAEFARAFPSLRYEVRVPTLDDLFLKLALEP